MQTNFLLPLHFYSLQMMCTTNAYHSRTFITHNWSYLLEAICMQHTQASHICWGPVHDAQGRSSPMEAAWTLQRASHTSWRPCACGTGLDEQGAPYLSTILTSKCE